MARSATKKSALTTSSTPGLARQAKRLSRQQKRLEEELMASGEVFTKTPTTRSRTLSIKDIKDVQPKTATQEDFFDGYYQGDAHVLAGSAGTGKSFISLYLALLDVFDPESVYDKIIIVRSVAQGRDMGFLPGSVEEKLEPFEEPYRDICADLFGRKDAYDKLKDMGKIEFASSSFLRGCSFNDSIIIFDECQNETFAGINTVMTRVGKCTKIVVIGDGAQTDISKNKNDMSGFQDFIRVSKMIPKMYVYNFTTDDIVRSGFVKSWLIACEKLGL